MTRRTALRRERPVSVLILLCVVVAAVGLVAQDPPPKPKPVPEKPPAAAKPAPGSPARVTATLVITADAPARIVVDGDHAAQVAADEVRRVTVDVGQHLVLAQSTEEESVRVRQTIEVKAPGQVVVALAVAAGVAEVRKARGAKAVTDPAAEGGEFDSPRWVRVPAGSFAMGCVADDTECAEWEKPLHLVTLTRAFELMATEVTVAEFRAFAEMSGYRTTAEREGWSLKFNGERPERATGISWSQPGFPQDDRHPVVHVSWFDAVEFCRTAGGRLPSEAEWEYAARGGVAGLRHGWQGTPNRVGNVADEAAKRKWPSMNLILSGYDDSFAYTAPVRTFPPNGFGLFDMTGNVWEWVNDVFSDYGTTLIDPAITSRAGRRVLRGNSWLPFTGGIRLSVRFPTMPNVRSDTIGFRCARDVAR